MSRWITAALAVAALAWVALLLAGPFLPVPAAGVLYGAGALICHQIAERSFHIEAFQLPVCARCFGLYAGAAIGAAGGALDGPAAALGRPHRRTAWLVTAVAALPTAITFALEWGAGWGVSNLARGLAGAPLGAAVAFVVAGAVATLHYDECASRRPIGLGQPPSTST